MYVQIGDILLSISIIDYLGEKKKKKKKKFLTFPHMARRHARAEKPSVHRPWRIGSLKPTIVAKSGLT